MLKIIASEEEYEEYEDMLDPSSMGEPGAIETPGEQPSEDQASAEDTPDRAYPDGQPIPDDLPPAYQSSASDGVPEGQACGNCSYNVNQMCTKFNNAPIRESWWCLKWEPMNG